MSADDLPPRPPGSRWTDAQWRGIAAPGNVLVSAAAGSGKTAVLAERCAYAVCDAPSHDRCGVDQLLVVTFGEEAAAEMKLRIGQALRERFERSPHDKRLMRQLRLIERAGINTLHGFCNGLIRQHFHRLGLDPNFTVLDGDEASLLRVEVARALFAQRYEAEEDAFRDLVDCYADGNDERLVERLIKTHELLASVVDPQRWMQRALEQLTEPTNENFDQTNLGRALRLEIESALASLAQKCGSTKQAISRMRDFHAYLTPVDECATLVKSWHELFRGGGVDALAGALAGGIDFMRLPTIRGEVPGKTIAKDMVDDLKKSLKERSFCGMAAFTREQWLDGLRRMRPHAEAFLKLVNDFAERYHAEKASLHALDFADLEREALRLLSDDGKHPSSTARRLHRQYSRVLVDEYQDINEVQDAILRFASRECLERCDDGPGVMDSAALSPNLFCVGDVKQAIYRFRLAEPALFLERARRYRASPKETAGAASPGLLIDLQANFRGREGLLAGINAIFGRLMSRDAAEIEYDKTHALIPGATDFPAGDEHFSGAPIELHLLPAKAHEPDLDDGADPHADGDDSPDAAKREADFAAQQIRALIGLDGSAPKLVWDKALKQSRPIRFGDIVVLLRAMKFKADDFAKRLRRAGIDVHADSSTGYFESTEVQDVLALLKVLDNRAQDIPLAAVLRSPIAGLTRPEDTLVQIRLSDVSIPFHQAVVRYAQGRHDQPARALRAFLKQIDRWRLMAQQRPLADVIWDIYDSSGYLAFCAGLIDGRQREANLLDLHARARQFGGFQRQGLARFLAFLDKLADESDLGQPSVVSPGENVVRIMSIHRSKGLEFPVVVLPDLGKKFNLLDCRGSILVDRNAFLGMDAVDPQKLVRYPSLPWVIVKRRLRRQSLAEELRILYVAMTRAREHLILIGTCLPEALDRWQARWPGHQGAFPADAIQDANACLDWLGPAACAIASANQKLLEILPHFDPAPDDGDTALPPSPAKAGEDPRQDRLDRLAALKPLISPPTMHAGAQAIIDALTHPYPYERFAHLPAVEAATALAKSSPASPPWRAASRFDSVSGPATLPLPRSIQPSVKPSAADIGQATHLVLQYLDFTRACDAPDLESQVKHLIKRRLIAPAAGGMVDLEALHWLASSPIGRVLRETAATVRREFSLYLALDPALASLADPPPSSQWPQPADPQDRIMVRCRIDALVETARGLEIIDYKTDRLKAKEVPGRAELYRPQMIVYRRAIERITARPAAAAHLVFLAARMIVSC